MAPRNLRAIFRTISSHRCRAGSFGDAGYEALNFPTDGFALVMMDIVATFEIQCLGVHLTGKLPGIINPVLRYLFAIAKKKREDQS
jgi:hypothetical protein